MSGQYRENWKRLVNKLPLTNLSKDDNDVVRFKDLDGLATGDIDGTPGDGSLIVYYSGGYEYSDAPTASGKIIMWDGSGYIPIDFPMNPDSVAVSGDILVYDGTNWIPTDPDTIFTTSAGEPLTSPTITHQTNYTNWTGTLNPTGSYRRIGDKLEIYQRLGPFGAGNLNLNSSPMTLTLPSGLRWIRHGHVRNVIANSLDEAIVYGQGILARAVGLFDAVPLSLAPESNLGEEDSDTFLYVFAHVVRSPAATGTLQLNTTSRVTLNTDNVIALRGGDGGQWYLNLYAEVPISGWNAFS